MGVYITAYEESADDRGKPLMIDGFPAQRDRNVDRYFNFITSSPWVATQASRCVWRMDRILAVST